MANGRRQPYVFISYASADRERVLPMVDALRKAGITCWIDQHDIAGDIFQSERAANPKARQRSPQGE